VEWDTGGRWSLQPAQPRLPKNIAFLTDGRAISYAESWMGIVEAYKLGAIVGETTAGTNGNINNFRLPGDYGVTFTGMKVLKHDGTRHHGVGIAPTVPVSPTLAGIRAGRDEQLEKAIEILERPAIVAYLSRYSAANTEARSSNRSTSSERARTDRSSAGVSSIVSVTVSGSGSRAATSERSSPSSASSRASWNRARTAATARCAPETAQSVSRSPLRLFRLSLQSSDFDQSPME
jgi:hypothetical protein